MSCISCMKGTNKVYYYHNVQLLVKGIDILDKDDYKTL